MSEEPNVKPLSGVRVIDLGQFITMPFCTQWMAWLGAEIIAIESRRHMTARTAPPFAPGFDDNPDASGYYNLLWSTKKSCTIDITTNAGCNLVRRLLEVSDVLVDNFSTGVMERLGLGYDVASSINPSIVMVSCGAFGRSGPLRNTRGLHSVINLFSGVASVTGYPGGGPRILGGVLPDPLSGAYSLFAILAALQHRKRTGEGQFIDVAMYEAMMTLAPEAIIDLTLNDRDPVRSGNRDREKVPHGIYPCRDPDTWIALSVDGEQQWQALCRVTDRDGWTRDPRFVDRNARLRHVDTLDQLVAEWSRSMEVVTAVDLLQSVGLPAGPVLRTDELLDDPRLKADGIVIETDHPIAGRRRQLGLPWTMDSLAATYERAPLLGEHTKAIMSELIGLDDEEIASLEAEGVLR